jgi:hypothetical protein
MSADVLPFNLYNTRDRVRVLKVLRIIRQHLGRENAISPRVVAIETEIDYRDVQAIVKYLVEYCSKPIGSTSGQPPGYYMIRNEDELAANYRHFLRRGISCLRHARAFNKASIVGPIVGQLELELNEDDDEVTRNRVTKEA